MSADVEPDSRIRPPPDWRRSRPARRCAKSGGRTPSSPGRFDDSVRSPALGPHPRRARPGLPDRRASSRCAAASSRGRPRSGRIRPRRHRGSARRPSHRAPASRRRGLRGRRYAASSSSATRSAATCRNLPSVPKPPWSASHSSTARRAIHCDALKIWLDSSGRRCPASAPRRSHLRRPRVQLFVSGPIRVGHFFEHRAQTGGGQIRRAGQHLPGWCQERRRRPAIEVVSVVHVRATVGVDAHRYEARRDDIDHRWIGVRDTVHHGAAVTPRGRD